MYSSSLHASCIEMESEESDADMQGLAGNFVSVNERAPVSVDGDQSQGTRRARYITPVRGDGGCRREMPIRCGTIRYGWDVIILLLGKTRF